VKALTVLIKGNDNGILCQMDKDIEDKWKAARDGDSIMTFIDLQGNLMYIPAYEVQLIVSVDVQEEVVSEMKATPAIKSNLSSR